MHSLSLSISVTVLHLLQSTSKPAKMVHIPSDMFMKTVIDNAPKRFTDCLELLKFQLVNKDFNTKCSYLMNDFLDVIADKFIDETFPKKFNADALRRVIHEGIIDMRIMHGILTAIPTILQPERKRSRYQHILKPLLTRQIFTDKVTQLDSIKDTCFESINFLISCYDITHNMYLNIDPMPRVRPDLWFLYALMDFIHLLINTQNSMLSASTPLRNVLAMKVKRALAIRVYMVMPPEPRYRMEMLLVGIGKTMGFVNDEYCTI